MQFDAFVQSIVGRFLAHLLLHSAGAAKTAELSTLTVIDWIAIDVFCESLVTLDHIAGIVVLLAQSKV